MRYEKREIEKQKLRKALDKFYLEMRDRLFEKLGEGYEGWDDDQWKTDITNRMTNKVDRLAIKVLHSCDLHKDPTDVSKESVDIANFAMFLYHANQRGRKKKEAEDV